MAHAITTTSANESDVSQTHLPQHGKEKHVHAEAGCQGAGKRPELKERVAEFVLPHDLQEGGQDGPEMPTDREGGTNQGEQTFEGGARISCGEEPDQTLQVPLQGSGEEHGAVTRAVRGEDLVLSQ